MRGGEKWEEMRRLLLVTAQRERERGRRGERERASGQLDYFLLLLLLLPSSFLSIKVKHGTAERREGS